MKHQYKSKYGHNTPHNSALAWKKDQNDRDRFAKAKMLRNYAKLCAKEGIQSDRVNMGPKADSGEPKGRFQPKEKVTKPSPFAKAEEQAKAAKQNKVEDQSARQSREQAVKAAEKRRKETTKLYKARTKKGQPLLSKMSSLLLNKISAKLQK
jgi:hypothetical protein